MQNVQVRTLPSIGSMETSSRRRYLRAIGGGMVLAAAGCVSEEEPEFLVTDTAFSVLDSGDMSVQVTVENGFQERRRATLEVVVRYDPEEGETEEWRQTASFELSGGTEILRTFRFEDVGEPGADLDNYEIEARLIDEGGSE